MVNLTRTTLVALISLHRPQVVSNFDRSRVSLHQLLDPKLIVIQIHIFYTIYSKLCYINEGRIQKKMKLRFYYINNFETFPGLSLREIHYVYCGLNPSQISCLVIGVRDSLKSERLLRAPPVFKLGLIVPFIGSKVIVTVTLVSPVIDLCTPL